MVIEIVFTGGLMSITRVAISGGVTPVADTLTEADTLTHGSTPTAGDTIDDVSAAISEGLATLSTRFTVEVL